MQVLLNQCSYIRARIRCMFRNTVKVSNIRTFIRIKTVRSSLCHTTSKKYNALHKPSHLFHGSAHRCARGPCRRSRSECCPWRIASCHSWTFTGGTRLGTRAQPQAERRTAQREFFGRLDNAFQAEINDRKPASRTRDWKRTTAGSAYASVHAMAGTTDAVADVFDLNVLVLSSCFAGI